VKVVNKNHIYKVTYCLLGSVISVIYIYVSLSLPHIFFRDRDVYLVYAESSDKLLDLYSGLSLYANEPLFLKINIFLNYFLSASTIVYFYLFICLFGIHFLLFKYSKNIFMFVLGVILLFLCNYSFHAEFVVLRQTIGSIILLFVLSYTRNIKLILITSFICSFIHSSFLLITAFLFLYHFLSKFNDKIKSLIVIIASALLGLFITVVGKFLGVRQASEDHIVSAVSVGGGAFICFLSLLIYFLFFYKVDVKLKNIYDFSILGLSLFVGLYFINPAAGRLMSTFIFPIVFLLCAKFNQINIVLIFFLLMIFGYLTSQGVTSGMSLNISFEDLFQYINMRILQ
jgi:hypothetical protein